MENNSSSSVATAPATTEMDKAHDSFITTVEGLREGGPAADYENAAKALKTYKELRTKYQGESMAYQEALAKRNAPPDKYDLALAEDSPLGKDYVKTVEALAKEKKLSKEAAENILKERDATAREVMAKKKADFQSVLTAEAEKLKAHPVMGGVNLPKTEELITRFIMTHGNEETLTLLKNAGATVNTKIVEMLYKAAQAFGPERLVMPRQAAPDRATIAQAGRDTPPAGFSKITVNAGAAS